MTVSGLRFGDEHLSVATWLSGRLSLAAKAEFAAMQAQAARLDAVWARSKRVDSRLVRDYRATRDRVRAARRASDQGEDGAGSVRDLVKTLHLDYARTAELRAATSFWVETGPTIVRNRGAGIPGNQLDLAAGSRAYFGLAPERKPRNTLLGPINIAYSTRDSSRNLRFGNNDMDKLDLPVPGLDGPASYENEVLRFERIGPGKFRMTVGTPRGIRQWKAASTASGTLYRMRGGREWGVFS
jgi:hypothetical protein